ncbi:MAG: hypothetical protein ABEI99_00150, partial [Halobaculum sp.]
DLESAKEDLWVAGGAAGTAVLVTVFTEFLLEVDASLFLRAVPLYVYFLYSFTRKGGPYTRFDTVRNWTILTVLSGIGVLAYVLS